MEFEHQARKDETRVCGKSIDHGSNRREMSVLLCQRQSCNQHGARGLRIGKQTLAMHAISRQAGPGLDLVRRVETSVERRR